MSAFAFKVEKQIPIPGAPNETAVIRKVGWKGLEAARAIVTAKGMEMVKAIGWAELQQTVTAQGGEDAIKAQATGDPFLQHDAMALLEKGLVSWSLSEKVTARELEALDEAMALGLAREIFELSRPKTEAEAKNG